MSRFSARRIICIISVISLSLVFVGVTACDDDDTQTPVTDTGAMDTISDGDDQPMDTNDGDDTSDEDAEPSDTASDSQASDTSDASQEGTPCPPNADTSLICGPHGECVRTGSNPTCVCEAGWIGTECRSRPPDTQ